MTCYLSATCIEICDCLYLWIFISSCRRKCGQFSHDIVRVYNCLIQQTLLKGTSACHVYVVPLDRKAFSRQDCNSKQNDSWKISMRNWKCDNNVLHFMWGLWYLDSWLLYDLFMKLTLVVRGDLKLIQCLCLVFFFFCFIFSGIAATQSLVLNLWWLLMNVLWNWCLGVVERERWRLKLLVPFVASHSVSDFSVP